MKEKAKKERFHNVYNNTVIIFLACELYKFGIEFHGFQGALVCCLFFLFSCITYIIST